MKIINPKDKEWLEKKGYDKKIFLDEKDLKNKGSLVQEIRIKPDRLLGVIITNCKPRSSTF